MWNRRSDEAMINGQIVDVRDAMQFAKALWSLLLEGEAS